jgi:hypothetical protein
LAPGQFVGIDESHVYYTATTMAGDCGAPLFVWTGSSNFLGVVTIKRSLTQQSLW